MCLLNGERLPKGQTAQVFGYAKHAHRYATKIESYVARLVGGNAQNPQYERIANLGDPAEPFNYERQETVIMDEAIEVQTNDIIVTQCTYNTVGKDTVTTFGEETTDEMCFNFLYVAPALNGGRACRYLDDISAFELPTK